MTNWRWRKSRSLGERLHGLRGVIRRVVGDCCASPRGGMLALSCDKRRGHTDGVCEDRAWIGGYK